MRTIYGSFRQCIKRGHLQLLIFNQTDYTITETENSEDFQCKFDRTRNITIFTHNPTVPDTLINFASRNCKDDFFLYLCLWGNYSILLATVLH